MPPVLYRSQRSVRVSRSLCLLIKPNDDSIEFAGTLESFNFADTSTPYPISLDYAVCIRKSAGFCGVSVNTFTVGDALGLNANSADPTQFFDEGCSRATATDTFFNADYISILGGNTVRRAEHPLNSHFHFL